MDCFSAHAGLCQESKIEMARIELDNVSVSYFLRRSSTTASKFERDAVGAPIIVGRKYIEVAALKGVSLQLSEGDRVGLIGTNGSGKSTLLRLCAGALAAQSGSVSIEGQISPQFALGSGMRPDLSGRQNTELKCLYMGIPQGSIGAQVEEVRQLSGLGGYFDLPIRSYSAGMNSRLVMSLLHLVRGEILIMDEWINAVDPSLNETIGGLQSQLVESAKILLLASHSERVLRQWVHKIAWLEQGTLRAFGPANEIFIEYQAWIKKRR